MLWSAKLPALGLTRPQLALRPADLASVDALCTAVGDRAARLLPHDALYVYWGAPGEPCLDLRLASLATPPAAPFPDYAGWLRETCYTPVPISLPRPQWGAGPRPWSDGDWHWLDLPVTPGLLLRYRLQPAFILRGHHRIRLVRWVQAAGAALARVALP